MCSSTIFGKLNHENETFYLLIASCELNKDTNGNE